ncbi:MAG: hypothetical protein MRZ23_05000 [Finegoldia magna]|nr:hypothetical protein [Finegoldia magna]
MRKTVELLLPILRALNKILKFKNLIYHRDIKPDNILFEKDGEDYKLFITDFGICYSDKGKERVDFILAKIKKQPLKLIQRL